MHILNRWNSHSTLVTLTPRIPRFPFTPPLRTLRIRHSSSQQLPPCTRDAPYAFKKTGAFASSEHAENISEREYCCPRPENPRALVDETEGVKEGWKAQGSVTCGATTHSGTALCCVVARYMSHYTGPRVAAKKVEESCAASETKPATRDGTELETGTHLHGTQKRRSRYALTQLVCMHLAS